MQISLKHFLVTILVLFLSTPVLYAKGTADVSGKAFYDLGVFAFEDQDYKGAEDNFKTAINYEPDNALYYQWLGKVFFKTSRQKEAEDAFAKAIAIDPNLPGLQYDLGYLYYKEANYAKAAELFVAVVKKEPANVLANYYAGLSLHKLEKYSDAVNYFIAAADKSPTIKCNGYYYAGTCYHKMQELESSLEKFQYVKENSDSAELKLNSTKYIQAIEKQKKAMKPYGLYAKVSFQYDDNVSLEPLDQDIYTDESDTALVAQFSGTYNLINRQDYKIGAGYSHYQTKYFDLTEYNLIGSTFNFFARYKIDPFMLSFSILPSHYWLDSDDYMERYQFRPEVKYNINPKLSAKASFSYYIINHIKDEGKDGHANETFISLDYALPENLGSLYGGLGFDVLSADSPDQDYDRFKLTAGISIKAPYKVLASLVGEYNNKEYDNIDSFYDVKRSDDKYFASISFSRKILYNWLSISLEYNYTKNNSNISDFEYRKNVGILSLTANL